MSIPTISQATQLATDSIGYVDQEVKNVMAIQVPAIAVGHLRSDLSGTKADANRWNEGLRSEVINTMRQVIATADQFTAHEAILETEEAAQIVAAVKAMQQGMAALAQTVNKLDSDTGQWETQLSQNTTALATDLQALDAQLTAARNRVHQLQHAIAAQNAKIHYYKTHPWKLILDGLSIVGLIKDLTDMITAAKAAEHEMQQLGPAIAALNQLRVTSGPLTRLIASVTGLGVGVSNLKTAVDEVSNTLGQIRNVPLAKAIIVAELKTSLQELQEAKQIANQVIQGS